MSAIGPAERTTRSEASSFDRQEGNCVLSAQSQTTHINSDGPEATRTYAYASTI